MLRFTIRSALLVVAIAAVTLLAVHEYLEYRANYHWPDSSVLVAHSRALTPQELAKITSVGSRQHTANLINDHPPRGLRYWQHRAQSIRPGMTEFALWRHVPQAAGFQACTIDGLSIPKSANHCLLVYAVDAQLAIACVMQNEVFELQPMAQPETYDGFGRVVEVIGFFEHDGAIDDWGCLSMTGYDIRNRISLDAGAQYKMDEPSDAPKDRASRFYNGNHNAGPR